MEVGTPEAQLQEALTFGSGLVGLFIWVLLFERRSIPSLGFRHPGRGSLTLMAGIGAGILLNTIPTVFLWAVGAYVLVDPPTGSQSREPDGSTKPARGDGAGHAHD
ncbi:hypothetical protein [Herbiconiux daphne]|uniref:Uncharacterized protein n=1 Tax=Herbiconiux daphne TaxID=2970914 RepID=A0ABT2H003_9MICO|nr:hypothetical protein [Herbiconiux daphne]MCS5732461.1 hypothetical protein [Herbiconiux daphne]